MVPRKRQKKKKCRAQNHYACSGVCHKSGFGFLVAITKRKTQSTVLEIKQKGTPMRNFYLLRPKSNFYKTKRTGCLGG